MMVVRCVKPMRNFIVLSFFILLIQSCAPTPPATLHIKDAWARPLDASLGIAGALYLTLQNDTHDPVTLVGGHTSVADTMELHQSIMEDDVMRMRPMAAVSIQPGEQVIFAPGGNHAMLKGLTRSLVAGDSIAFTMRFAGHAPVTTYAVVQWEAP